MKKFSKDWKGSKKPKKQRKYRAKAPLHLKKKFLAVHLTKDLRGKYKTRNVPVRTGDKVRVLRGRFKKKEGKIERIDRKREQIYVTGLEIVKKDGTKVICPLRPSNLVILELNLNDKKRKAKLERKTK